MNKQAKANGGRGIEWTDYTWNPIAGCFHACQWTMPDGTVANCYAEDVADRVAGHAYPNGFEFNYWKPQLLNEPLKVKAPAKIFVGSMADVFGHWVEREHILDVLEVCDKAHWHTFQFLTKNPKRVWEFVGVIPPNCWIGASTPPDFMWNKPLKDGQRERMLTATLNALGGIREMGLTTWLSAEPITIDVGDFLQKAVYPDNPSPIDWMVIGAASNGKLHYPPEKYLVECAVYYARLFGVKVFFKGNLRSLKWAADNWREDFPQVNGVQA